MRQDLLNEAAAGYEAGRAIAIFQAWLNSRNQPSTPSASSGQAGSPQAGPAGSGRNTAPAAQARPVVSNQVMPERRGGGQPEAERKTYTWGQYEEAMDNITKGKYSPQRADEVQREFDAALREGRIR
jgi:hypothetical protein